MLSLSSLGALFFRGGLVDRVITGYSGDTFPNFTPEPVVPARLPLGRRRGRALVVPRVRAAARGGRAGSARDRDPLDRRFVDGGRTTPTRGSTPRSARSGCSRRSRPTSRSSTRRSPTSTATSRSRRRCSKACGVRSRAKRGAIVTVEKIVPSLRELARTWCASPRTGCSRCARHRSARTPVGSTPAACRSTATARTTSSGSTRAPRPAATTTTPGSRSGSSGRTTQEEYLERARARIGSPRSAPRPSRTRGRSTSERYPPDLDAPVERVGGRGDVRRAPPRRPRRRTRRRRGARRRGRREPGRLARRRPRPRRRAPTSSLTAEIGLWGYEPTPADPFVLNHRNFPSATMLGDAAMVLQTLVGGPGTTTIGCLGGAQVDRHGNVNSTDIPGGPFLVGSGGGNDVASVAAEVVVVATLTPQRTPSECGYVTSPGSGGARARHRPRPAREAVAGRRARPSSRCPRARSRSPSGSSGPGARAAGHSRSRTPWSRSRRRRQRRSRRCGAGTPAAGSCAPSHPRPNLHPEFSGSRSRRAYADPTHGPGRARARDEAVRRRHRGRRPLPRLRTTASSSCCSVRPAAGSPPRCAWSPGSRTRPTARSGSGPRRRRRRAEGPQRRDGVPELRALPAHDGAEEHRVPAADPQGRPRRSATKLARDAAETLGLDDLLERKPAQLSGGQRQRVALARAIVRRPDAFLMDEPLSNLDAKLRVQTRAELIELQRRLEATILYVTHDQVEAMTMGHRIAIMSDGVLQQIGPPQAVYEKPANLFVARFIGNPAMNTVAGPVVAGRRRTRGRGREQSHPASRAVRRRSRRRSGSTTSWSECAPSTSASRPRACCPRPCRWSSRSATSATWSAGSRTGRW